MAVKCNHSDLMMVYTSLLNVCPCKRYWEMETQEMCEYLGYVV